MPQDLAVLDREIAVKHVSGNVKLADDLLVMFIKELPDYQQIIKKEHLDQNKDELRNIIHKIHGGLRYLGAPALMDIISKTDYSIFELSDEQLKNNIEKINCEIARVIKANRY